MGIYIDDVLCDDSQRSVQGGGADAITLLTCSYNRTVVGHKNMSLYAALQHGPTQLATDFNALYAVCSANYYALAGNYCLPCPPGATCAGFVNNVTTLPIAEAGWYNLNGTVVNPFTNLTLFDLCPDARGLPDRADKTCIVPCQPLTACLGNNSCAYGYMDGGPLYRCSNCAPDFYHSNGDCVKCPSAAWALIVIFIIVSILLCIAGWILNRKNVNIAFLSIGVDYFQVLALFYNTKVAVRDFCGCVCLNVNCARVVCVQWPSYVEAVFHALSVFNFNIDLTAPECAFKGLSYELKWWISMQLPVGALTIFFLIFISNLLYKRLYMCERRTAKLLSHKNALIGMFFVMFYFLYLYL